MAFPGQPINRLQQMLQRQQQLNMAPSPYRSLLVQQLMAAQPRGSMSPIESINNASKPILAALLARRENQATERQNQTTSAQQQRLMAMLQRLNDPNTDPAARQAAMQAANVYASNLPQGNPLGAYAMQQLVGGNGGEGFTLGDNQGRYDAQGKLIVERSTAEEPTEPDQVNIRAADSGEIFAANIDPVTGVATAKDRSYQPGEYQRVSTSIQGTPDEVFPTEGERNRALGSRNLLSLETAANDALNNNPEFDPTALFEARGDIPLVGNIMASPGFQQYRAAADEWTANMAYLRSGTTARQDEKESAFQNFWYRVGDDAQTMPFKRRLRLEAMREAYIAGARANRIGSEEAGDVLSEIDRELATMQQSGQPREIDFNSLPE